VGHLEALLASQTFQAEIASEDLIVDRQLPYVNRPRLLVVVLILWVHLEDEATKVGLVSDGLHHQEGEAWSIQFLLIS